MFASRTQLPKRALLLTLVLAIAADALAADPAPRRRSRTPQPAPVSGDPYDLVFLGPQGCVLIRMMIDTGKRTIADTRRDYASLVFRALDSDASSALEPAEAAKIPQTGVLAVNAPALGDGWKALDTAPADDSISSDELYAFVDRQLGPQLRVALKTRPQQSVRLSRPLDADGDEHVSREEIEAGLAILHVNDFDDDGTLSVAELQPYPTAMLLAMRQQDAESSGDVPLSVLTTEADRAAAAERLLNFYSSETRLLACEKVGGMAPDAVRQHDSDQDGHLNAAELQALLATDAPRLTFQVRVGFNSVRAGEQPPWPLMERLPPHPDAPQRLQMKLAGMPVSLGASVNRDGMMSDSEVIVNQLLVRFIELDGDKNRYLDDSEFTALRGRLPELGLPDVDFAGVDANGDKMVVRDELKVFAQANVGLAEAALEVMVSDDAKTLFDMLDGNLDNRLSPREFLDGFTRVEAFDHDRDGRFGMSEMRSQYGLIVSRARPQFVRTVRQNPGAAMGVPRVPRTSSGTAGPTWFRKMDRNQDGDVAWREFLGARGDFDRIDADGNGLIDLNEAIAAAE